MRVVSGSLLERAWRLGRLTEPVRWSVIVFSTGGGNCGKEIPFRSVLNLLAMTKKRRNL
jgi:hypothetical protein